MRFIVKQYFRLILIAEKSKVYEEFPTPLINRLEKHFLVTSTILTAKQEILLKMIEDWVEDYLQVSTMCVGCQCMYKFRNIYFM